MARDREQPAVWLHDNLMWTKNGTVWATWRLRPTPFRHLPFDRERVARLTFQALLQSLRGEAVISSYCAELAPEDIINASLQGVNVREHPAVLDIAAEQLSEFEQRRPQRRTFWLSVPLGRATLQEHLVSVWHQMEDRGRHSLGFYPRRPLSSEITAAREVAAAVEKAIPRIYRATRATPEQQRWVNKHQQSRGLVLAGPVPEPDGSKKDAPREPLAGDRAFPERSGFLEPWIDGAAATERDLRHPLPHQHNFLKVVSPLAPRECSYQQMYVLSSTPREGWTFPGMELFDHIDQLPFGVDWSMRLRVRSGGAFTFKNRRVEANLIDQLNQYGDNADQITGGAQHIVEIASQLKEFTEALNADDREVGIDATVALAVGADNVALLSLCDTALRDHLAGTKFIFDSPVGAQEALWLAMQPGTTNGRTVAEFAQMATSAGLSSVVPLVTTEIGSKSGFHFATVQDDGRMLPMLLDIPAAVRANKSACVGFTGTLGSGKSYALMLIGGHLLSRGARVVAIDKTTRREWATFFAAAAADMYANCAVVDVLDPQFSVDPLRILHPGKAARAAQALLGTLGGISMRGGEGLRLSRLLAPEYRAEHDIDSLPALREHLVVLEDGLSRALLDAIDAIATKDLGRVLFDLDLPVLDLEADAIVVSTDGLELPTEAELTNEHLYQNLGDEKIFGNSIYAYMASLAREVCFSDQQRLGAFITDEIEHIQVSPRGARVIREFIYDSRKHGAVLLAAGQAPSHFGDEDAQAQIPIRGLFAQPDEGLAKRCAVWMGLASTVDDVSVDVVEAIQNLAPIDDEDTVPVELRGQCYIRDHRSRIARAKVVQHPLESWRTAADTTALAG